MTAKQAFSDLFYSAPDGLKLHARVYGEGITDGSPVVCLPGLSRNARDFHDLAVHLSQRPERPRMVAVFDYRGRGLSPTTATGRTTTSWWRRTTSPPA